MPALCYSRSDHDFHFQRETFYGVGWLPSSNVVSIVGAGQGKEQMMIVERVQKLTASDINSINHLLLQLSPNIGPIDDRDVSRVLTNGMVFCVRADGRIIGLLTMVLFNTLSGLRARIEDVVVDNMFRRGGVARALCAQAIEEYKKAGAKTLNLTSSPSREAANMLYHHIGFVRIDTNVYAFKDE